jgi:uncharacterized membrane protein
MNNLAVIAQFMMYTIPISFFIIIYLIKSKLNRREHKRRENEGSLDIILQLSFTDKIISDIILFLVPIIVLLIPLFTGVINYSDLLQAAIVFIIFYFWQKYLFSKDTR